MSLRGLHKHGFYMVILLFWLKKYHLFPAAMVALTESICWKTVKKSMYSLGIGAVMYQKPISNSCYEKRVENNPPLCNEKNRAGISWYMGMLLFHLLYCTFFNDLCL